MQCPSLFLLRSSSVCVASCLLVGWHEFCRMFQGLSLFGGDALVAALCELFSVSIGHTENVVGFYSLVGSTVAWNRFSEGEALFLGLDAEEDLVCLV